MNRWTWQIPNDTKSDTRADVYLLEAANAGEGEWTGEPEECSRSQIKMLMEAGKALVDKVPLKANMKLKPGALVEIEFPDPLPSEALPENIPLDILFQDAHLVVINKPAGMTVHPSSTQMHGTLVNALLFHIKDLSGIGGTLRPGIVHRIDKDTSGALVVTKDDITHRALSETFAKHEIERRYWALCYGTPPKKEARIESLIGRSPNDRKRMTVLKEDGRKAVTHYRQIEAYGIAGSYPFGSLIEATLETGRTHQVRVHLTHEGCSLLGDPVYGNPTEKQSKLLALPAPVRQAMKAMKGQALHARVLGFNHPITGEKLRFEAEPPPEFAELLRALQAYRG